MTYVFEIFNKDREMIRRGDFEINEKMYYGKDADYYVIKMKSYPYSTIQEGYLNKKRPQKKNKNFVMYGYETEDEVVLMNNTGDIVYHIVGSTSKGYEGQVIALPKANGINTIKSENNAMTFKQVSLSFEEEIRSLSCDVSQYPYIEAILSMEYPDGLTTHEKLIHYYNSLGNTESKHIAYGIIQQYELKVNSKIKINSETTWDFEDSVFTIIDSKGEIDEVNIYVIDKGRRLLKNTIGIEEPIVLRTGYSYMFDGRKNGKYVSSRIVSSMPYEIRQEEWYSMKMNMDQIEQSLNKAKLYGTTYEDERMEKMFQLRQNRMQYNSLLSQPEIVSIDSETVDIDFPEFGLMEELGGGFMLAISKDKDIYSSRRLLLTEVTDASMTIDVYENGLYINEDCFVWIEDANGNRVSDFSYLPEIMTDPDFYLEVYENERSIVQEKLFTALDLKEDTAENYMGRELLSELMHEESYCGKTLIAKMIEKLILKGMGNTAWASIRDMFNVFKDTSSLFEHNVGYSTLSNALILQENRREIITYVHEFDNITKEHTVRYSDKNQISINPLKTVYMYFIDKNTYEVSEPIMISKGRLYANKNITIERV